MNGSQYLPYTAYTVNSYPPRHGAPGYHNVPAMAPAQTMGSGPPATYPPPAYNNFIPMQQPQQHQLQQPHQNLSAWPYGGGYAPMAGQIEDIVSPSPNNMPTPPGHKPVSTTIPNQINPMMHHPSSLPQVQDVFAPRQSSTSPFGTPNQMTQMANGTSRMVGAYPPMPPGGASQGSSPTMGVPRGPVDPGGMLAQPGMGAGLAQGQQMVVQGGVAGVGFGGGDNGMGMVVRGGGSGYSQFNLSP